VPVKRRAFRARLRLARDRITELIEERQQEIRL
jgi:hypothetical protein